MDDPSDIISVIASALQAPLQSVAGIGDAIAGGPASPPVSSLPPGHPFRYTIKNGEILDSAGVKVSPESLERDILKLQKTIKENEKVRDVAPKMVDFANKDLQRSLDAIQEFLQGYRVWKGK